MRPAAVVRCEAKLLETLKAPSSYKLIDTLEGLPEKDGTKSVFLTYDAVNSYNAPIRGKFWCKYDPKADTALDASTAAMESAGENMEAIADNIAAVVDNTAPPPKPAIPPTVQEDIKTGAEDETPVCDRPDSDEKSAEMNAIGTDCSGE